MGQHRRLVLQGGDPDRAQGRANPSGIAAEIVVVAVTIPGAQRGARKRGQYGQKAIEVARPAGHDVARACRLARDRAPHALKIEVEAQTLDEVQAALEGKADIILGSRFKGKIEYMPLRKRLGNRLATWAVRRVSGLAVSDAQTGFRAFSREAALRMNIQSSYTYTQETILLAAEHKLRVAEIPVAFRRRAEGESRLVSSIWGYAKRVSLTLVIGYLNYKPLKIFLTLGLGFFLIGFALGLRVLIHYLNTGLVSPHIPTAILTAILLIFGFQIIMIGLVAEMIKRSRKTAEEILYLQKKRSINL